jgi:hypothetical protein
VLPAQLRQTHANCPGLESSELLDGSVRRRNVVSGTLEDYPNESVAHSAVVERNGGDDETRTRDLCRDGAAL